jgi:acyl-ACP thioesterase
VYEASTQGRRVSARLSHPGPPEPQAGRAWPLRATDFDPAGHVNNSVHWAAVEDILAGPPDRLAGPRDRLAGPEIDWLPASAELEYHRPIVPGHRPHLVTSSSPGQLCLWLLNGTQRLASARLTR